MHGFYVSRLLNSGSSRSSSWPPLACSVGSRRMENGFGI